MGSKLRCLIYKSIFAFKYYQNFIIWFKTQLTLMPRAPISPKLLGAVQVKTFLVRPRITDQKILGILDLQKDTVLDI